MDSTQKVEDVFRFLSSNIFPEVKIKTLEILPLVTTFMTGGESHDDVGFAVADSHVGISENFLEDLFRYLKANKSTRDDNTNNTDTHNFPIHPLSKHHIVPTHDIPLKDLCLLLLSPDTEFDSITEIRDFLLRCVYEDGTEPDQRDTRVSNKWVLEYTSLIVRTHPKCNPGIWDLRGHHLSIVLFEYQYSNAIGGMESYHSILCEEKELICSIIKGYKYAYHPWVYIRMYIPMIMEDLCKMLSCGVPTAKNALQWYGARGEE